MARHFYEPSKGHGLPHDPLNAIVAPRPIGWIGTRSRAGQVNLAPYSFFNLLSYRPPIIAFSSAGRKDSLRNVEETGEFVWNLCTRPLAEQMNETSGDFAPEVNEMDVVGLTAAPSRVIDVPLVAESPVSFECRMTDIVPLKGLNGDVRNWLVIGEVVAVHIDQDLLVDGVYDTAKARPVTRGGGTSDYFEITPEARFHMRRPKGGYNGPV